MGSSTMVISSVDITGVSTVVLSPVDKARVLLQLFISVAGDTGSCTMLKHLVDST